MTNTPQNPTPNPNPTPQGSDNFWIRVAKFIKGHPLIVAFFTICIVGASTFGIGIKYQENLDQNKIAGVTNKLEDVERDKKVVDQNNNQLVSENTQLKSDKKKLEEQIVKLQKQIDEWISCNGEITSPSNGESVPKKPSITISVGQCRQTRVWLVASPNGPQDTGLDCYLIGEATRGQNSKLQAHPLQQSKPYIVKLIKNNENINNIPKRYKKVKETQDKFVYDCSDIGVSDPLDQVELNVQ